jgi:hypothetical protein
MTQLAHYPPQIFAAPARVSRENAIHRAFFSLGFVAWPGRCEGRTLLGRHAAAECAFHVERRSPRNRILAWLCGQPDEFLGRQASFRQRSTHRRRLEGTIIATIGVGPSQHLLDTWTLQADGSCLSAVGRPPAGRAKKRHPLDWLISANQRTVVTPHRRSSLHRNEEKDLCLHRPSVERDKEEDGLARLRREKTREREAEDGARLTFKTGSEFPIGPTRLLFLVTGESGENIGVTLQPRRLNPYIYRYI